MGNLHLHIAESVWRFNHRHDDIYLLLLACFRANNLLSSRHDPFFICGKKNKTGNKKINVK